MDTQKRWIKKILFAIVGLLVALLFSTPYVVFREQIQEMSVVGYVGLLLACVISNVSILIPSSATIIVLVASTTLDPWLCILCGGLGTAIGEQSSYVCGLVGTMGFDMNAIHGKLLKVMEKYAFLTVFVFALAPLPVFDIIGMTAGVTRMNWVKYTLAAVLGKTLKFLFAVVGVFYVAPLILKFLPGSWDKILEQALGNFGIHR